MSPIGKLLIFGKNRKGTENKATDLPKTKKEETPIENIARPILNIKLDDLVASEIIKKLTYGFPEQVRAGYLLGKKTGENSYDIIDVDVPDQTSGPLATVIAPQTMEESLARLASENKVVVGFAQYHNKLPVFDSSYAVSGRENLAMHKLPKVSLVINAEGKRKIYQ